MIKTGIIGGGGYTAGELIRLLNFHPDVELKFIYSESQQGKKVSEVHEDLLYLDDLRFIGNPEEADVLFLCQGHGNSKAFMENHSINEETLVIDLGNDFRLHQGKNNTWVYGLPELNREKIKISRRIANCGCFATAIQLALLPLAQEQLINADVHISAITGSTGAGQKLQDTTHFTWRQGNVSVYKAFSHQHEGEILQSLSHLQPGFNHRLRFVPYRGNFTRGILASVYTPCTLTESQAIDMYRAYYDSHPFIRITEGPLSLKQVVNTNFCYMKITKSDDLIHIESTIDNLLKGASGQAVQNMNLATGLKENSGLLIKPSGY